MTHLTHDFYFPTLPADILYRWTTELPGSPKFDTRDIDLDDPRILGRYLEPLYRAFTKKYAWSSDTAEVEPVRFAAALTNAFSCEWVGVSVTTWDASGGNLDGWLCYKLLLERPRTRVGRDELVITTDRMIDAMDALASDPLSSPPAYYWLKTMTEYARKRVNDNDWSLRGEFGLIGKSKRIEAAQEQDQG